MSNVILKFWSGLTISIEMLACQLMHNKWVHVWNKDVNWMNFIREFLQFPVRICFEDKPECWGVGQLTRRESLLAMFNFKPQLFISKKEKGPFTVVNLYGVWIIIIIILFRCIFPYLFIGREPSMWSANNCLEISVLLQITFCSCIIQTPLLCENGRIVPELSESDLTS